MSQGFLAIIQGFNNFIAYKQSNSIIIQVNVFNTL